MTARHLFVLNRADDRSGGTLTAALNLAEALMGQDVDVVLSFPLARGDQVGTAVTESPVRLAPFPAHSLAARLGFSLKQLRWLWRMAPSADAVHIHSCFYAAALYTALICRLRKVPYVVWPHGSLDAYDVQKHSRVKHILGPVTIRPLTSGARAVICTNEREIEQLVTFGARPHVVAVPLPVPPPLLPDDREAARRAWRARYGIAKETVVILFLGRISLKKRVVTLIEAMALLADLDVHLVVAGDADSAEQDDAVQRAISAHQLTDRVTLTGWLDATGRGEALVGADVFALPSDNENFGLAVVESMLAGLAAVISDNVYLGVSFTQAGAAVVAPQTVEPFARALRTVCADGNRRRDIATHGQQLAAATFAPAKVGQQLLAATRD